MTFPSPSSPSFDCDSNAQRQVAGAIKKLQRDLAAALAEKDRLAALCERQKLNLKICRNAMRAAGIEEQYPGANPRIANDWQAEQDLREQMMCQGESWRAQKEAHLYVQLERDNYSNYIHELLDYVRGLQMLLEHQGVGYSSAPAIAPVVLPLEHFIEDDNQ